MRFLGTVVRSTSVLVFGVVGLSALAQEAPARQTFAASDMSFTFTYPSGWRANESGRRVQISGPDGSHYLLQHDMLGTAPAGDAANNSALRDAAEKLAKSIVSSESYAGVKVAAVGGGSGAIYRFRGKGAKSDSDLVEIWIGVVGSHTITLTPESAPVPDHVYELSTIFRSISFADTPTANPGRQAGGPGQRRVAATGIAQAATPSSTLKTANTGSAAPASSGRAVAKEAAGEMERYDGHLISGDIGFTLHLNHGGTAAGEWTRSVGRVQKYSGTYAGEDGNYAITLRESGADSAAPAALLLTLRSIGGMVGGQYALGPATPKRDIADLKLTEVDAGNIKLRGTAANVGTNRANQSNNTNSMNRIGRGRRRR